MHLYLQKHLGSVAHRSMLARVCAHTHTHTHTHTSIFVDKKAMQAMQAMQEHARKLTRTHASARAHTHTHTHTRTNHVTETKAKLDRTCKD